jgi:hypothetical protein
VLTKVDGTDFNTVFSTPSANYITAVTAPLSVTSGNLSVNLSTYLPLAGGTMDANATIDLSDTTTGTVSELGGYGMAVSSAVNANLKTNVFFDRVLVANATGATTIKPTGVEFPDLTLQTSAGISAATASATYQTLAGMSSYLTTSAAASTYQTLAGMSSYLALAGGTMTGKLLLPTSTTSLAPLYIYPGVDPTTANTGDIWVDSSGVIRYRLSGTSEFIAYRSWVTAGFALKASPTLTGTPLSTTAAVDTNTTQIATTAFVIGQAGSATPLVNGVAAVGTSLRYAREDHVHGTDTTRAALASPSLTGTPLSTTAAVDTNTTQIATTAYVIGNGYLKSATAATTYYLQTNPAQYQTVGDLSSALAPYLLSSTAATTYYPLVGNPSGFLTSAPVTSVAGMTGAVVLANTDISGLGTMSTATAADYSTTTAADALYYPLSGNPSGFLTSAPVTSVAGMTGAVTLSNTDISGLGTMAVETATNYLTTATASATYFTIANAANKADLASPTFTGVPLSTTAAADTNTTQIATTAYVVGQASASTPANNGTAAIGTSLKYARADHVHATDTTRAPLASPTFTGTVTIPVGASISGFAPLASPTFTGTPTLPTGTIATTQTAGNSTTAVATTAFVRADNNVKAWVNFNGTGTVAIRASYNVTSITDNGTGTYTVNFTTAMADVNYGATLIGTSVGSVGSTASFLVTEDLATASSYGRTTSAFPVRAFNFSGNLIDSFSMNATFIR